MIFNRTGALLIAAGLFAAVVVAGLYPLAAQTDGGEDELADLWDGKNFIPTQVYSEEEDRRLLELYEGLFVADVVDGMDAVGLQNIGNMSPEIHPLWRDAEGFAHRFVGIALTTRYVPTNKPPAGRMDTEDYDEWAGRWYGELSPEPFIPLIRQGTALVIEDAAEADVGTIGSNNILAWVERGCVGVVTSATARDTDEIAAQKVPLYYRHPGRGIRPGRNEIESVNRPIVVGGVLVEPGDVILADGDGVVVVPRDHAREVAEYARGILDERQEGRRELYERLGLPPDESVE